MTLEETLSGLGTVGTIIVAVIGAIFVIIALYLIYKGVKKMAWRPKDKTKLRNLYMCTVCGIPFSTQQMLVTHMKNVHNKSISTSDTKAKVEEVSYEEWEVVRLDEEEKEAEFEAAQTDQDNRVVDQLTGNPDDDPDQIVSLDKVSTPRELYKEVSTSMEKPRVTTPSEDLFSVQYMGDRVFIDIAMIVPNTPEVIEAINKLNEAMGK